MPRIERVAEIVWEGNLARGAGAISAGTRRVQPACRTRSRRGSAQPEGKTSPEELLAAAHGGCFTMSLAGELTGVGHPPERLETTCRIVMDEVEGQGHQIVGSRADRPRRGAPTSTTRRSRPTVERADEGCPFSALLKRAGASVDVAVERL